MASTITDIARVCQLSPSTVSLALRNSPRIKPETRERVHREAQRVGYRPNSLARGLKMQATKTLGYILPSAVQLQQAVLLDHIYEAAFRFGYQLQILLSHDDLQAEARAIERCLESQVEGLVLVPSFARVEELPRDHPLWAVRRQGLPCVLAGRATSGWPCVMTDANHAVYAATRHLIERGYRDLRLLIVGPYLRGQPRRDGFARALREAGLDPAAHPIIHRQVQFETLVGCDRDGAAATQQYFNYRRNAEHGSEMVAEALAHAGDGPVGLVCSNDRVAAGVLRRVLEMGRRVPEDIAITGCDDTLAAEFDLTTYRWNYARLAEALVGCLMDQIHGRAVSDHVNISGELIVRHSSGERHV